MQKILIADGSQSFCMDLSNELKDKHMVEVCLDGVNLLQHIRSCKPRVLVIDLILPGIDGIGILHEVVGLGERPVILVLSRFVNDFVLDQIRELGVEYVMRKPCEVAAVAQHVEALIAHAAARSAAHSAEHCPVTELLLKLGVPAKLKGSKYLQRAVSLMLEDPEQLVTKELYPAVGREYGVDGRRVERCIRNAIHIAWQRCDGHVWGQYFLMDAGGNVLRPTNAEFISRLTDIISAERLL